MVNISGHAVFTPNGHIKVGDQVYSAKHIVIASGGHPVVPSLPGKNIYVLVKATTFNSKKI